MKQLIHLTLLFLFTLFSFSAAAQIFSGTMAAVWKDDFGSGEPQLPPQGSPNITSGYPYQNTSVDCNNWLHIPNSQSYVTVGDIDIPGTQITIEGLFSRDSAFTPEGYTSLNVVSKHWTTNDVNYLLRVDRAQVTTTTGHHMTPDICNLENKKLYHAAMTYDGSTLKFYRNGFLMSQVPCTGTLFQNNYPTTIAATANSPTTNTTLIGYLNEVRIWNVAKTQAELQLYMNSPLPNPTTQPGLLGYYTFETLINKQGNSLYDAVLHGNASINETVPNCNFTIDTCTTIPATADISRIINQYTPVVGFLPCENKLTVEDASEFNAGDTVLLIQMKGAVIDSTNSANFGTITDYKNAGNYEFNYVKTVTGNIVELQNILQRQYDIPVGKVQLIRVPFYKSAVVTDTLTCLPWDGRKGGVLVFNVQDTLTLDANIDVSEKGFSGGKALFGTTVSCNKTAYYYPPTQNEGAAKGESIAEVSIQKAYGRGCIASGGGGGNSHNAGGAGGGNGSAGGAGGQQYPLDLCPNIIPDVGGIKGSALDYSNALNKIYLGGGGGAGHANDLTDKPGGNGGAIVIISANTINGNARSILANGGSPIECTGQTFDCANDGSSAGGAGGTILINATQYNSGLNIVARGGKGANAWILPGSVFTTGPGGGGAGGVLWLSQNSLSPQLNVSLQGGLNGVGVQYSNNPWGATPGQNGINLFSLRTPIDTVPFRPNIDSVIINDSLTSCKTYDFKGNAIVSSSPIQSWQWNFGDNNVASTQNASHTYTANGTYTVKLLVTDINGCKDSIVRQVSVADCQNGISKIINKYAAVLNFNPCTNSITVDDATPFSTGDTVLLIQMKGAVIDSTNSANFGTITDYKNAGNYEFNYVKTITGNIVELQNILQRQYDVPLGKVQLIRVPYYQSIVVTDTLTCLPWDGNKGGVLVLNVKDQVDMQSHIDVSGRGFRGGKDPFSNPAQFNCYENEFYYPANPDLASEKGEGIATISVSRSYGKGALANGGGGGNSHNSGGGGGGNAGAGGLGGYQYEGNPCNATVPFDNRGRGGKDLPASNVLNKIFLGGGGGAGQSNNPQAFEGTGGNGAGIVIINAGELKTNNYKISANGLEGKPCGSGGALCHEGMGGGGAGGFCLLNVDRYLDNTQVEVRGGKGADMAAAGFMRVAPGGGGGAGMAWLKQATLPINVSVTALGGANGVCPGYSNTNWGAEPGLLGVNLFELVMPVDSIPFKPNIDSVIINDSLTSCKTYDFKGNAIVSSSPIQSWQWNFGDNNVASTQNASHTYSANGTYTVKLVVTDINGCKDSILRQVSVTDCQNGISRIINEYAAVLSIDPCTNRITVDDASLFNIGDTIMIMQMKGAFIESSNSSSFGNISSYNNAGNYELNYVKSKTGNSIELLNTFLKQYDAAAGKVQLIRVPYFQVVTITDTLTCPAWNGSKGGVVVLYSATEVNLDAPIDVSRKGFRGGQVGAGFSCNNTGSWAVGTGTGGTKGEGITEYITGFEAGGARLANGGGGAYAANTGGGGGANFGGGGTGGNQSNTCGSQTQSIGGEAMDYSNSERVFLGGGGGGGQQDDGQPVAAGGTGGGIAIIIAATLNCNNQQILANGESISTLVRDEGGAGGGAGGSILLHVNGYAGNLGIEANGGTGSSNDNQIYSVRCHGPGAGGGGGYVGYKTVTTPPGIFATYDGGQAGLVLNPASACFNTTHGATNGEAGGNNFNLALPVSSVPFQKNIDSVKISSSITACKSFNFSGIAFTNTSPVQNWQWNFGDGNTASTQNTTHTYAAGGTYSVKLVVTDINGCQDSASAIINPAGINFDFILKQDVCNPRSVQFTAIGDSTNEIFWSFGDGSFSNNIRNPAHVYADTGFYLVRYSTGNGVCVDTVSKTIFIGYRPDNIILTPDTTICFGSSKLLRSNIDSTLGFCWSPANFLDDVNLANPTTNTAGRITYTLLSLSEENNLVVNGDFSNGNIGFSSDLSAGAAPLSSGSYLVTNTSLNAGPQTSDCKDHTNTAGNMMVVSSTNAAASLWNQTVAITPNTNYIFSSWIQSVQSFNSTQLQLSINGNVAADNLTTAANTCEWTRYFVTWNSGSNTTAILSIFNKANPTGGDFFAIDDISFAGYIVKRDTVMILVDTPLVTTITDTAVCQSVPVQLTTSGAVSYSWSPVTGLSNPAGSNPDATPDTTTQYVVTGTNANGCVATDAVLITVKPKPTIIVTGDTLVCRNTTVPLFASGGTSYLWSPAATLSNASISNPVATPGTDTVYRVTVTGANNCSSIDSVKITIQQAPVFTVSPDQRTCSGNFAQLAASGGDVYSWSPAAMLSDANISNPVSLSNTTTTYTVTIKESTCNDSVSLSSTVTVLPLPTITAGKSNDIDCTTGSANLQATGALQYVWSPATGLNDINSAAPVASPVSTTLYTVKGTDGNGCSADDAVTVLVDLTNKASYAVPNAFTPNGDGKNDCFGVKYFGPVQEFQLVIFNRWGERVFFSSNAADCWDGTFKGNPSDNGNYIYFIKAKTACGPVERKGNVLLVR